MIIDGKNVGGRPLKFKDVDELTKAIDAYFASLYDFKRDMWGNRLKDKEYKKPKDGSDDDNPFAGWVMQKVRVATVTGLAVALDTTRETLLDYESGKFDDRDEKGQPKELTEVEQEFNDQVARFSDTIKRAKLMIYADTEQQLYRPGVTTGAIFSLKNNYNWQDKTTNEVISPDGANPFTGMRTDELRELLKGGQ